MLVTYHPLTASKRPRRSAREATWALLASRLGKRDAVEVIPAADEVDALRPAVSVVALPNELLQHVFSQLCNVLDPGIALAFGSVSNGLRTATQALQRNLKTDHEAAAALCLKVGLRSCKELREATRVVWHSKGLTAADLGLLGRLGSVLPALESLHIFEDSVGPDGVQRLAEGLGAGALPAVTWFQLLSMHMGDAGASALAAALGRGALPRLQLLALCNATIGDAGLVALAPALRRLPALEFLHLMGNPFGDEGIAALVAPPPPAGVLSPQTGVLARLEELDLECSQVSDAGCATLADALDSGALPALEMLGLSHTPASAAAIATVYEARPNLEKLEWEQWDPESEDEESEEDGEEAEYMY